MHRFLITLLTILAAPAYAQTPPSTAEIATYTGLHAAAAEGDLARVGTLLDSGANVAATDASGRTALHVAAFASYPRIVGLLVSAGADIDAQDVERYDILTIAAVADDLAMVDTAIALGADVAAVTSIYDGTALIAAAHLGHYEVVAMLIAAGAPVDHVNNLGWTALLEAVVLGDGGPWHQATVAALLDGGASVRIADNSGATPLDHAQRRGYREIEAMLRDVGAD